jgi:hypothetical protein
VWRTFVTSGQLHELPQEAITNYYHVAAVGRWQAVGNVGRSPAFDGCRARGGDAPSETHLGKGRRSVGPATGATGGRGEV